MVSLVSELCRPSLSPALFRVALVLLLVLSLPACSWLDGDVKGKDGKGRVALRDWAVPASAPGGEVFQDNLHRGLKEALSFREAGYKPRTEHLNPDGSPIYTNRLILESSPYLLQHAHNPVNWYAWGEEAFEDARRLGRPVLLSVGYSTCHWCHVMERESFEDEEIATFMNQHYIAIKVDREERPDIDSVYMTAVRALTGGGGWPMTVVMNPDGEPFFGGTYFPARDGERGSRAGFLTILRQLSRRYAEDPDGVASQAARIVASLERMSAPQLGGDVPASQPLHASRETLSRSFDSVYGGFGQAPKFPRSVTLDFLLRYHRRSGNEQALHMAVYTLERMAAGGMYDHVGGGFHRYSTDRRWLVPHFEKMLYDNAQLVSTYLSAHQVTGREDFARVAGEILDYVVREMTAPEGGFYSATDADSLTPSGHQEEGWFFTWTTAEIHRLLGADLGRLVEKYYGVTPRGNFEGRSILHTPRPLSRVAADLGLSETDAREELAAARQVLYQERAKRPPPGKDTKVITSWNGLMISAFARGAQILEQPGYLEVAQAAAAFMLDTMVGEDGGLKRSFKDGRARIYGVLDDYAFLASGLLDLFEASSDPRWLAAAISLHKVLAEEFWDEDEGGFYFTSDKAERLLVREKPYYDGAEPAGNSVAIENLLRLYEFTTDENYHGMAERALGAFSMVFAKQPTAAPRLLAALDMYLDTPKEIIIVKPDRSSDASALTRHLASVYVPNRALVVASVDEAAGELGDLVPLLRDKVAQAGRVTAYVCERRVCKLPTSDPEVFAAQIAETRPYP